MIQSLVYSRYMRLTDFEGNQYTFKKFIIIYIREGNDTPLQYSCLENPRDGGAWWAAIYGVAQSRTRLKRLSSNSSSRKIFKIL